jgi:hypothetical protein
MNVARPLSFSALEPQVGFGGRQKYLGVFCDKLDAGRV